MKLLLLCFTLVCLNTVAGSFYDITIEALDGSLVKTSSYQGKKVVITVVSANSTNLTLIRYLDSVQKANNSVQVIAIPTGDFSGDVSLQNLKALKKNIGITVSAPLKVTKAGGALQHPLFVWLTQSKENQHFNMDVSGEGQVFVVSPRGTLYSVLSKETPLKIIGKAINQNFTE